MIGIALMGAGRMARVYAKAIGAAGGRLVTVYDIVESAAARSLASDNNASVARSVDEALQHPDVDGVFSGRNAAKGEAAAATVRSLRMDCLFARRDVSNARGLLQARRESPGALWQRQRPRKLCRYSGSWHAP